MLVILWLGSGIGAYIAIPKPYYKVKVRSEFGNMYSRSVYLDKNAPLDISDFKETENKHKYGICIAARNEDKVIKNLLESINNQDYPKELLDIYVIADNCTDNTAKIAREAGAIVYERFDETKKTKGYAMQWFLNQKVKENADYDAFCVFDADNIVTSSFFENMNNGL